jgi:hypothetical protein
MRVEQKIEAQDLQDLAYGTSGAKSVTVSFWVKSYQTGNYVVNFYAQDGNRQITRTYTVNASATWEYKSVTIPGDTSGTINNDTGSGLHLAFPIIADSGYLTTDSTSWINYTDGGYAYGQTVNLGSSTDNYWKITGVQLEVGSQATAFEHRSMGEELALCQRYFQKIDHRKSTGSSGNRYMYQEDIKLICSMRAAPSLSASSEYNSDSGNYVTYTAGDYSTTTSGCTLGQASTTQITVTGGSGSQYHDVRGRVHLDAEI